MKQSPITLKRFAELMEQAGIAPALVATMITKCTVGHKDALRAGIQTLESSVRIFVYQGRSQEHAIKPNIDAMNTLLTLSDDELVKFGRSYSENYKVVRARRKRIVKLPQ